jgi:hypothetical protein
VKLEDVSASVAGPGLCPRCVHMREIRSDRGSVFIMCTRSFTEPEYPKYPRLPVLRCQGFEEVDRA